MSRTFTDRISSTRLSAALAALTVVLVLFAIQAHFSNAGEHGDAVRGEAIFSEDCAVCHGSEGSGGQGPSLRGVYGRKAGTASFAYSDALKAANLTWDEAQLDRYLENPAAALPGTTMPLAVPAKSERRDLIAYLKTLAPFGEQNQRATSTEGSNTLVFGDWRSDYPGRVHRIRLSDLPPPYATSSAANPPRYGRRPAGALPRVPKGFAVGLFAEGLSGPRMIRTAPNGDLFVAESYAGRVRVLRPGPGGNAPASNSIFARGLSGPFGIAFYPPGPDPRWVYVAENNRVVRFAYRQGDLEARSEPEVVVAELAPTAGGHVTRDIAFSLDGTRLFVSVGSSSNVAQGMEKLDPEAIRAWEERHGLGAAWGFEANRADVLVFSPEGKGGRVFASGLRNCVGLAVHPTTGELYCSTNERDGLGDNLVPDYVTRVKEGAWYGWPWRYMGDHEDPRWKGARPDLAGKITNPDVPLQPHSASLGLAFYAASAFPADYQGAAFAAFHGSWNRATRTGYKVVRILMRDGVPTGEYEDFLTGFVIGSDTVWGRPVGIAVGADGALYVSEDANGTIWRIAFEGADRRAAQHE